MNEFSITSDLSIENIVVDNSYWGIIDVFDNRTVFLSGYFKIEKIFNLWLFRNIENLKHELMRLKLMNIEIDTSSVPL